MAYEPWPYWVKMAITMIVLCFVFAIANCATDRKPRLRILGILFLTAAVTLGLAAVASLLIWMWTSL